MRSRVAVRMMRRAMCASAEAVTIPLGMSGKDVVLMIQRVMFGAVVVPTTPLEMIAVAAAVVAEQTMPPVTIAGADVAETTLAAKFSIGSLASPDEIATCPGSYHRYIKHPGIKYENETWHIEPNRYCDCTSLSDNRSGGVRT
jgi:hypothetical protein